MARQARQAGWALALALVVAIGAAGALVLPAGRHEAAAAGECRVQGRVLDAHGDPVPAIRVRLAQDIELRNLATDAEGRYDFGVIGGAARRLSVELISEEYGHVPRRYEVYAYQQLGRLRSDVFGPDDPAGCARDFAMAALPASYRGTGVDRGQWPDLIEIFQRTRRAWELADLVGVRVTYGLPLRVNAWCDDRDLGCAPEADFAGFAGTRSDSSYRTGNPYIALGEPTSALANGDAPDNREYHEVGHFFQASLFGHVRPLHPDNAPHGGYYREALVVGLVRRGLRGVLRADGVEARRRRALAGALPHPRRGVRHRARPPRVGMGRLVGGAGAGRCPARLRGRRRGLPAAHAEQRPAGRIALRAGRRRRTGGRGHRAQRLVADARVPGGRDRAAGRGRPGDPSQRRARDLDPPGAGQAHELRRAAARGRRLRLGAGDAGPAAAVRRRPRGRDAHAAARRDRRLPREQRARQRPRLRRRGAVRGADRRVRRPRPRSRRHRRRGAGLPRARLLRGPRRQPQLEPRRGARADVAPGVRRVPSAAAAVGSAGAAGGDGADQQRRGGDARGRLHHLRPPHSSRSYGYVAVLDDAQQVLIATPPRSYEATVTVMLLADGFRPAVVGRFETAELWEYWDQAPGESIIAIEATLQPDGGDADIEAPQLAPIQAGRPPLPRPWTWIVGAEVLIVVLFAGYAALAHARRGPG